MADLPKTNCEVREIPDWPEYAIDRSSNVWERNGKGWRRIRPIATSKGFRFWFKASKGTSHCLYRKHDLYRLVFGTDCYGNP